MEEYSKLYLGEDSKLVAPRIPELVSCHSVSSLTVKRGAVLSVAGSLCIVVNDISFKSGVELNLPSIQINATRMVLERDATLSVSGQSDGVMQDDSLPSIASKSSVENFAGGMHASLGGGWYLMQDDRKACMRPFGSYIFPTLRGFAGV